MSALPAGPIVDPQTGEATPAMRAWMLAVTQAMGGPAYDIRQERVNDTTIRRRMKGSDGVIRYGPDETLTAP